jgi:plastocyanin
MRRALVRLTGVCLLGPLLVGCGEPPPVATPPTRAPTGSPAAAGTVEVRLSCATGDPDTPCAFRPAEITIRVGSTVRWVNDDATFHTVTSSDRLDLRRPNGRFDAVLDAAGETFEHTFSEPGSYPYYCQPHAEFMAATVNVVPG